MLYFLVRKATQPTHKEGMMLSQPTEHEVYDRLDRWVSQHNRTENDRKMGSTKVKDLHFSRKEGGLTVTSHSTLYYDTDDVLNAVGIHLTATFNNEVVYERMGSTTKTYAVGAWIEIVTDK
jgi:hypothetical protein